MIWEIRDPWLVAIPEDEDEIVDTLLVWDDVYTHCELAHGSLRFDLEMIGTDETKLPYEAVEALDRIVQKA